MKKINKGDNYMSKPKFMLFSPQQMQEYVNNSQSFEEILQKM